MRLKTPYFFFSDSGGLERSESMMDQIRPISAYETFLRDSGLREGASQPIFLPGVRSLNKLTMSRHKSSLRTDVLQFSNMKNNFVTLSTGSGNLFRFKLQLLSYSVAFHLLGFLSFSSDEFCVIKQIDTHSNRFHGELYSDPLALKRRNVPELTSAFWTSFSQQLLSIQLHLLGAFYKLCIKHDFCRGALARLSLFERSLNAYTESHGVSVTSAALSMTHSRLMVQKGFEMSLYLQNRLFMDFDNSATSNRPPILDQLRRDKDKSKLLLDDFGKIGQGDDLHIRKGTGSVGFKSSMRKATLSLSKRGTQTLVAIKEKPESAPIEFEQKHQDFLQFIHDYYVTK